MEDSELNKDKVRASGWKPAVFFIILVTAGIVIFLWKEGALDFLRGGDIIAVVNGEGLYRKDFDWRLDSHLKTLPPGAREQDPLLEDRIKKMVMEKMIDHELIFKHGNELGIKPAEDEVERELGRRQAMSESAEAFKRELAADGMTMDTFRKLLKKELVIYRTIELQLKDIRVAEADLKVVFERNKNIFDNYPEEVKASHILLRTDRSGNNDQAVLARIREIREKILGGEDFAKMVIQYSEETGAKTNAGNIGYFQKGRLANTLGTDFEQMAFSTKVGMISEPVRTPFGFHLIKVEARRASGKRTFEQVKDNLSMEVYVAKRQGRIRNFILDLRSKGEIDVKPKYKFASQQAPMAGVKSVGIP